ncbi:MAG: UTP--glucose-1-phosphate uridylyltransferase [Deltaproteobacteria bacterium]|nr:UTP--glucose-1-phosphate uridylyltransferase [Deltaproteobacteria bacterium]
MSTTFIDHLFKQRSNRDVIATAAEIKKTPGTPKQLLHAIKSSELEDWLKKEALTRLSSLPDGLNPQEKKDLLEMANRYPDGSMEMIALNDLNKMSQFVNSPKDLLDRARQGFSLLKNNTTCQDLGTVARGVPGGGASSRAAKWTRLNPETARKFGLTEQTPRPLFYVQNKTLLQHTLDFSRFIAQKAGVVFPNIIMTNSENVSLLLDTIRTDWTDHTPAELANTILFNQIVLPRLWVEDGQTTKDKLYPAGHGDYPFLMAKYGIANALRQSGIRYFVFSNADEWLWQADPVMISIADELFHRGHHMIIIGTKNTNNQFGGGFVRKQDGTLSLVETPRLPWSVVKKGEAPVAINTTFYLVDVEYLASHENKLLEVEKSLVVKEVPARQKTGIEQIIGVDSWAGDCFAAVLNPVFIEWPRLNFLGIKDGGFISGTEILTELGNRSYQQYVNEAIVSYPRVMNDLINGDTASAQRLLSSGYSYLG